MLYLAAGSEPNVLGFAGDGRRDALSLVLHLPEVGGELKVIALAPFLVRVMMAFGALHADAEENLADKSAGIGRLSFVAEDSCRAIFVSAAFGCEQLAHKLIVGLVLLKAVAQPKVEQINRFDSDARRIGTNEIAPFYSPVIGIGRIVEEAIDCTVPFVCSRVPEEFA